MRRKKVPSWCHGLSLQRDEEAQVARDLATLAFVLEVVGQSDTSLFLDYGQ